MIHDDHGCVRKSSPDAGSGADKRGDEASDQKRQAPVRLSQSIPLTQKRKWSGRPARAAKSGQEQVEPDSHAHLFAEYCNTPAAASFTPAKHELPCMDRDGFE